MVRIPSLSRSRHTSVSDLGLQYWEYLCVSLGCCFFAIVLWRIDDEYVHVGALLGGWNYGGELEQSIEAEELKISRFNMH